MSCAPFWLQQYAWASRIGCCRSPAVLAVLLAGFYICKTLNRRPMHLADFPLFRSLLQALRNERLQYSLLHDVLSCSGLLQSRSAGTICVVLPRH